MAKKKVQVFLDPDLFNDKPDNMPESKFIRKILKGIQTDSNKNLNRIWVKYSKILYEKMCKYGSNRLRVAVNDALGRVFTENELEIISEELNIWCL